MVFHRRNYPPIYATPPKSPVLFKSSTKDLSFPIFELVIQHRLTPLLCEAKCRHNVMILDRTEILPILIHDNIGKADILPLSRWDSDLEAFNLNPAHVSFSALTFHGLVTGLRDAHPVRIPAE
jgi:hypothetical protein